MKTNRLVLGAIVSLAAFTAAFAPASGPADATQAAARTTFVSGIDNPFFPLTRGTTYSYRGTKDGTPASNEVSVERRTKRILRVETTVVHDRVYEDGVLVEDTFDWYAQDTDGNVWYFGEDAKELDAQGNVISTEGSWQAGVDGAQQGIVMEAHPHIGDRYRQELAPGVAEDMAQVVSLHAAACVAYGCFDDLLATKEWTPLNKGVVERKLYASGIGLIAADMVKGGSEHSELVAVTSGGR